MGIVKLDNSGFFTMDCLKEMFLKDGVFHLVPYSAVVCEPTFYKNYSKEKIVEVGFTIPVFLSIVSTHSMAYQLQRNPEFQLSSNMSADMFLILLLLAMMTTYNIDEEVCSNIIAQKIIPYAYVEDNENKEYLMFMKAIELLG